MLFSSGEKARIHTKAVEILFNHQKTTLRNELLEIIDQNTRLKNSKSKKAIYYRKKVFCPKGFSPELTEGLHPELRKRMSDYVQKSNELQGDIVNVSGYIIRCLNLSNRVIVFKQVIPLSLVDLLDMRMNENVLVDGFPQEIIDVFKQQNRLFYQRVNELIIQRLII